MKAKSATAELMQVRKELGADSRKEGVERCAQAQVRDRAQVFGRLVLFLHRVCLAFRIISIPVLLPLGYRQIYLGVRRSMDLDDRSHKFMALAFRRGRLPSAYDLYKCTVRQAGK